MSEVEGSESNNKASAAPVGGSSSGLMTYEKASQIRTMTSYIAAAMLVVVGISRLLSISEAASMRVFVMTFYFVVIGIIVIAVECGNGASQQYFLFLNFGWGKVFLYMFLVCSILQAEEKSWLEWVITIIFLVSSGFNLYLDRYFKE